jgi:hypothetical protein
VVLGDRIEDLNMIKNLCYDNLICIGFLNSPTNLEEELKAYLQKYDVVIVNDGSFEVPN